METTTSRPPRRKKTKRIDPGGIQEIAHLAKGNTADLKRARTKLEALVREKPLLAALGAAALGAVLGGMVFSRAGRLAFVAAAGFLATEAWKRDGELDLSSLLERLMKKPHRSARA